MISRIEESPSTNRSPKWWKARGRPPKNGEKRVIPFPELLDRLLSVRCVGEGPKDAVFQTLTGGTFRNTNFRRDCFNPAVAASREADPSFPKVTPHDLRHTLALLAVSAGANVKSLQHMLGNSRASISLDTYADLFQEDLDEVALKLNTEIESNQ